MTDRHHSATSLLTGFVGIAAAIVAIIAVSDAEFPKYAKAMIVILATAVAMIIVEIAVFRSYLNATTGLSASPLRPFSLERTITKLTGFLATLVAIGIIYWLLPEYHRGFYKPYWAALRLAIPWVLALAPFYVVYIDRRQADPNDAYAAIGAMILSGQMPDDFRSIRTHILGWVVKAFFLPMMFVFASSSLNNLWSTLPKAGSLEIIDLYRAGINVVFLFDLIFGVVGYVFTFRILDSHIRTAEPTILGWLACLVCYRPFSSVIMGRYLAYGDSDNWLTALPEWPVLQGMWALSILFLLFIYTWSTICFGLRFSNLTHRGIISSGPYRWVKHPAYLTKNLSWWLMAVPFLSNESYGEALRLSMLLLLVNGLYAVRAITEERHLSWDPEYVAYKEFIRRDGLWARIKRSLGAPMNESQTGRVD